MVMLAAGHPSHWKYLRVAFEGEAHKFMVLALPGAVDIHRGETQLWLQKGHKEVVGLRRIPYWCDPVSPLNPGYNSYLLPSLPKKTLIEQ